jgi:hypothetical protein
MLSRRGSGCPITIVRTAALGALQPVANDAAYGRRCPDADLPLAVIRTQRRAESGRLSATVRGGVAPFRDPDGSRGCATGVFGFPALTPLQTCLPGVHVVCFRRDIARMARCRAFLTMSPGKPVWLNPIPTKGWRPTPVGRPEYLSRPSAILRRSHGWRGLWSTCIPSTGS